jgi:hypothetical protein
VKVNGRKVLKARGGKDASQADFGGNTPGPGDTGGAGGYDKDTRQFGNQGSSPTSTGGKTTQAQSKTTQAQSTSNKTGFNINPITTGINLVGQLATKIPGLGYAYQVGKNLTTGFKNTKNLNTARKEDLLGGEMLTTAKMNRPYAPQDRDGNNSSKGLCPDGSNPPCKLPTTQIKTPVSKPNPFLSGFKAYDDGGEVIISGNVDKDLL